jgi:hypothetical protein
MSLGNVLGSIAPIAAGYFGGPALAAATGWGATASSIAAGALAGGGIAALSGGDILGGAAMGGLSGLGGGSLASAFNPATAATIPGATTATMNSTLLSPYTNLAPGAMGGNVGMMANPAALSGTAGAGGIAGINPGVTGALSPVPRGVAIPGVGNVTNPTTGFASKTPGVIDPLKPELSGGYAGNPPPPDTSFMASMERLGGGPGKEAMGMGKLGLTAAPVLSAAFTPEPLSYDDYNKDEKYDPNRSLNLNMDTGINEALTKDSGLRLFAKGGTVQPQAGGGGGGGGGVNNLLRNMMEGTAQNMQTTGVPEGMSIADVIRAGRGYMPGPKGGVKLAQGGYLDGGMLPGDGMSDDVPANIDGEQEAALSQGEFVVPADVVSHLGNGSSDAGSKKLYAMMDKVRQARTGNKQQGKQINPERYMPA